MSRKKEATVDVYDASHTIFSENRKISPRQIRRAMTLELFGISSLLLPPVLAGESGIFGLFALAVGAAGAYALVCLQDHLSEKCRPVSGFFKKVSAMLAGIGLLALAAYLLCLLTALMRDQLLSDRYEAAILLTLTAAGIFGLQKGLEARIRIYEVLFWLLLVPLVIVLVVASAGVKPVYWVNTAYSLQGFLKSCYHSFLFFSVSSLFLLFRKQCNPPARAKGSVRTALILTLALDAAVYLILLGIFQDRLLSQLDYPVILLMAVVKLPGGFFERQDALMVGIWFFCLFALFDSVLYYAKEMPADAGSTNRGGGRKEDAEEKKNTGERKRTVAAGCVCMAAVFAAALFLLHSGAAMQRWLDVILYGIGPALLVLSILTSGRRP